MEIYMQWSPWKSNICAFLNSKEYSYATEILSVTLKIEYQLSTYTNIFFLRKAIVPETLNME